MSRPVPQPPAGQAPRPQRGVVSFVRRGSRLSRSRQDAWDRSAERWVLDVPRGERDTVPDPAFRLDLADPSVFGRRAPLVVEIGSGQGENIAHAAASHPERDHLAFEVYTPGIAQTLDRLERAGSPDNIAIAPLDALHSLTTLLAPGDGKPRGDTAEAPLSQVWIFFPDPWHKTKHHKRRLVNPPLLDVLAPLMAPGAVLRLATDWAQYAAHMRAVLDADDRFANLQPDGARPEGTPTDPIPADLPERGWAARFEERVLTSFERKAQRSGRNVWDLAYARTEAPASTPSPAGDRA